MGECFIEAGVGKIVAELRIHLATVSECPLGNFFGNILECVEVGIRIAVPPRVIGDDGNALAEEFDEFVGHCVSECKT